MIRNLFRQTSRVQIAPAMTATLCLPIDSIVTDRLIGLRTVTGMVREANPINSPGFNDLTLTL